MDFNDLRATPESVNHLKIRGIGSPNNCPANIRLPVYSSTANLTESIDLVRVPTASLAKQANFGTDPPHSTDRLSASMGFDAQPGNCYCLPWSTGKAYIATLRSHHQYFFTPSLTACGFFIGGTQTMPTVCHANADVARLDDVPFDVKEPWKFAAQQTEIYRQFYSDLATSLIKSYRLPNQNLVMFRPDFYRLNNNGTASIFGVCAAANWTFYYNLYDGGVTRELWPNFRMF